MQERTTQKIYFEMLFAADKFVAEKTMPKLLFNSDDWVEEIREFRSYFKLADRDYMTFVWKKSLLRIFKE